MSDFIDRQAAIEAFEEEYFLSPKQILESLPSAKPTGKWIRDRYCSNCEWSKEDADYTSNWSDNFCPNCGADMRGKDHE